MYFAGEKPALKVYLYYQDDLPCRKSSSTAVIIYVYRGTSLYSDFTMNSMYTS